MAGSYAHVIADDGSLASSEHIVNRLDTGGDVVEAIEQMYGMIWYLAHQLTKLDDGLGEEAIAIYREDMRTLVEEAQQNYEEGLDVAKEVNQGQGDE
jgi:hypothetical protein